MFITCTVCKIAKKHENFSKSKINLDGFKHQCKECRKLDRLENIENYKIYEKNRYAQNKDSRNLKTKILRQTYKEKNLNSTIYTDVKENQKSKLCTICKKQFILSRVNFSKDVTQKDGYDNRCKPCKAEYLKYLRDKDPEKQSLYRKRYYELNKDKILESLYNVSPKKRYNSYKSKSKQRGWEFPLTYEEFYTFWNQPCFYCGDAITGIGLDRFDNLKGYTLENCRSCCTYCNAGKLTHTYEEFVLRCKKIVDKHLNEIS